MTAGISGAMAGLGPGHRQSAVITIQGQQPGRRLSNKSRFRPRSLEPDPVNGTVVGETRQAFCLCVCSQSRLTGVLSQHCLRRPTITAHQRAVAAGGPRRPLTTPG